MREEEIDLRSVNWEHGMLVTPDHFLRQERYFDSALLWMLRYCTDVHGLAGAGPRAEPAEQGAAKHDPIVEVHDEPDLIKVSVARCRGISTGGDLIEIDPAHSLSHSFSKKQLEGHQELGIYVVCRVHNKIAEDGFEDLANPDMKSSRRRRYELKLDITAEEASHSLLVDRLVKSERGLRHERKKGFIPPCTTMASHSELMQSWRKINDLIAKLAAQYIELHRAVREYIQLAEDRPGINTKEDYDTYAFTGRMVETLERCANEVLEPLQPPQRFFQQIDRTVRCAALYLDLSPATQEYFRRLGAEGQSEYPEWLRQDQQVLTMERRLAVDQDLGVEVRRALESLSRLQRLEEALEGKYVDFRLSRSLEGLRFVFDRWGESFYESVHQPSYPMLSGEELTFVFAPLNLKERRKYRIILIGQPQTEFEVGERLTLELRINPNSGQRLEPIRVSQRCEILGQKNFAFDFEAPETVLTILDLRAVVRVTHPILGAMLYVQRRLHKLEPAKTR